jgi:hypothetical protein
MSYLILCFFAVTHLAGFCCHPLGTFSKLKNSTATTVSIVSLYFFFHNVLDLCFNTLFVAPCCQSHTIKTTCISHNTLLHKIYALWTDNMDKKCDVTSNRQTNRHTRSFTQHRTTAQSALYLLSM